MYKVNKLPARISQWILFRIEGSSQKSFLKIICSTERVYHTNWEKRK